MRVIDNRAESFIDVNPKLLPRNEDAATDTRVVVNGNNFVICSPKKRRKM